MENIRDLKKEDVYCRGRKERLPPSLAFHEPCLGEEKILAVGWQIEFSEKLPKKTLLAKIFSVGWI